MVIFFYSDDTLRLRYIFICSLITTIMLTIYYNYACWEQNNHVNFKDLC